MNNLMGISLFERTAIKIKPREVTGRVYEIHALVCSEGGCVATGMLTACGQESPRPQQVGRRETEGPESLRVSSPCERGSQEPRNDVPL